MQIKCVDERFFHIDAKNIELRIRKQLLVGSQIQNIYPVLFAEKDTICSYGPNYFI